MPKLDTWGGSDQGLVRPNNEDNWSVAPDLGLAIVADGMGGAAAGEVASALTVETILAHMRAADGTARVETIEAAIGEAHRRVLDQASANREHRGMGSTVVLAHWELPRLIVANVGDSRAYLWRDGCLRQLSEDHTLLSELRAKLRLTDEEAARFPHKHVLTMAVGAPSTLKICAREEVLVSGDTILLCSDGLTGPAPDEAIAATLSMHARLDEIGRRLIALANDRGGPDNVTVVLLRYDEDSE